MFTGIVQGVRPVVRIDAEAGVTALRVDLGHYAEGLKPGASVALNGTCLTAVESIGCDARFDLVKETRELTNLGTLRVGSLVNVERSFRVGDEVGGHILSGHTAALATVTDVQASLGHRRITVAIPAEWMPYLMPKGFVALNGASLTIQELDRPRNRFTVSLIPETLARTTFGEVAVGDGLNLEVDAQTQAVVDTVRTMLPELVGTMSG